jgi:hypothetical protein
MKLINDLGRYQKLKDKNALGNELLHLDEYWLQDSRAKQSIQ